MNNKVIYSKIINETEFLRSLSLKGQNSFNTRLYNFKDILDEINARLGFPIKNNVLCNEEIEAMVLSFFTKTKIINKPTYQDIVHFINTFNNVRLYITEEDEKSKISALVSKHPEVKSLNLFLTFVDAYFETIGDDLDVIMYARKLISLNKKVFDNIIFFKEDNLTLLEKQLLETVGNPIEKCLLDLYGVKTNNNRIVSIEPRYGVRNEVAHVIKDISEKRLPLSDCEIVLINKTSYVNELYKFKNKYKYNMTFETGLPINLSSAYKLYKSLTNLENKYFCDVNGYLNLFSSESIDNEALGVTNTEQVAQILGRLKINFSKENNDEALNGFNFVKETYPSEFELFMNKIDLKINASIIEQAMNVISEFSKGISYVLRNYTKKNTGNIKFENAAIDYICSVIDFANGETFPADLKDSYISVIENKYLNAEVFEENSIHVTDINKALSTVRKNVYILGLNSSNFPGSITEDYLFNDKLYEELTDEKIKDITLNTLKQKNEYLKLVIETFLSLDAALMLSYNAQEIKEVRTLNGCSVLLDYAENLFKEENARRIEENKTRDKKDQLSDVLTEKINKCSYYSDQISNISKITDIAIENKEITLSAETDEKFKAIKQEKDKNKDGYLAKQYSPSYMSAFLKCQLRFYIEKLLYAGQPIRYSALNPIDSNRFGDLFHYVMERYLKGGGKASLSEVLADAEFIYGLYVKFDRSITDDNIQLKEFKKSVTNAFNYLHKDNQYHLNECKCELNLGYDDSEKEIAQIGGLHFRGNVDLVTTNKDGQVVIIDYKTGQNIDHTEDDPISCVQGLIYAQIYELIYKKPVSDLVFYYTRIDKPIHYHNPCSSDAKAKLESLVGDLYNALNSLTFKTPDTNEEIEEACKYCLFSNICHVEKK